MEAANIAHETGSADLALANLQKVDTRRIPFGDVCALIGASCSSVATWLARTRSPKRAWRAVALTTPRPPPSRATRAPLRKSLATRKHSSPTRPLHAETSRVLARIVAGTPLPPKPFRAKCSAYCGAR
jgi:hypothetical protein